MAEPVKSADMFRAQGPWDVSEEVPDVARLDLGGLRIPIAKDVEVQVNVSKQGNRVVGINIVSGKTVLQVQPFAAPKSSGLWDEVRAEITDEITKSGGQVEEFEGTFGTELRAVVPVSGKTDDKGEPVGQPARFFGVDGPRWFLRGVIRGEGAVQPTAAARIEEVFQGIVVVRGDGPIPPRDLLPLDMPAKTREAVAKAQQAANGSKPDSKAE